MIDLIINVVSLGILSDFITYLLKYSFFPQKLYFQFLTY